MGQVRFQLHRVNSTSSKGKPFWKQMNSFALFLGMVVLAIVMSLLFDMFGKKK